MTPLFTKAFNMYGLYTAKSRCIRASFTIMYKNIIFPLNAIQAFDLMMKDVKYFSEQFDMFIGV